MKVPLSLKDLTRAFILMLGAVSSSSESGSDSEVEVKKIRGNRGAMNDTEVRSV